MVTCFMDVLKMAKLIWSRLTLEDLINLPITEKDSSLPQDPDI